ncbi:thioredoxin reductase [Chaetomium strumarium]|uniref:Thioredoxin reductase n=1 Tax=Chaetomium strumarium TaxID=1170767 RepID=A0AAJ0LYU3_9PEZI|nr:thioredoxin reductase [Chaetomium strumarium]
MATGLSYVSIGEDRGEVIIDSVARVLNAAGVPCVLWAHLLWSTHGVPTYVPQLDLVIPDAGLAAASEAMMTGSFSPPLVACPDPTTCRDGSSPERRHPHTAFHMHIEGTIRVQAISCLCFYVQSETLWFLPPLSASLAKPRECPLPRYLAFAVVLVPKVHILTEALMRIMARDHGTRVGSCCVQHFLYIPIYVEQRGILDISLLPELFEELYKQMTTGSPADVAKASLKLRRNLGAPLAKERYR